MQLFFILRSSFSRLFFKWMRVSPLDYYYECWCISSSGKQTSRVCWICLVHGPDRTENLIMRGKEVATEDIPWRTWRVTEAGSALDGVQEYLPESESRTWRNKRDVDVMGLVLSVTMATPPRAESWRSSFISFIAISKCYDESLETFLYITWSWWCQKTYSGGSGLNWTTQVRFTWLPTSTWNSGPPRITAFGAVKYCKLWLRCSIALIDDCGLVLLVESGGILSIKHHLLWGSGPFLLLPDQWDFVPAMAASSPTGPSS